MSSVLVPKTLVHKQIEIRQVYLGLSRKQIRNMLENDDKTVKIVIQKQDQILEIRYIYIACVYKYEFMCVSMCA